MSLIIATGSNLGDSLHNLALAKDELSKEFKLIAASKIYYSDPIEYLDQEKFYNQVLEFKLPKIKPLAAFALITDIEKKLGRKKVINKGPRNIDIDIIFWELLNYQSNKLSIPHHSWHQRSFVVLPLKELPYFKILKNHYTISNELIGNAISL